MSLAGFNRRGRALAGLAACLCALLLTADTAFGQASGTTATLRGTVEDTSGGVLPGATVTLTNARTGNSQFATANERGGYVFSGLFPGTYVLKVELEGFKTYEQQEVAVSPGDTRGLDVRLEIGDMSEVITVTQKTEVIQTETGAREGVLTASQIDNLSTVGRSSLELLRILPGVVTPSNEAFEEVTFGGGANNTQGYTVNGIRSSNNTVQLDGAALIDIGSNSGLIVTLNNDMVQEVRVQSSNFAAEHGTGGMSISAVTKSGGSRFSGTLYDYVRHHKFSARDRSTSIAGGEKPKSEFQYPGGNIGGPIILPGTEWNRNRDKAFFFFGFEVQRQKVDAGTRFGVVPTELQRQGIFTEFAPGSTLLRQSTPAGGIVVPSHLPGAGSPIPGANLNNCAGCITELGRTLVNLYPTPNYVDPDGEFNYILNALEEKNRYDMKMRFDYNITNNTKAYLRVAYESEEAEGARGVWWQASEVALPSPNLGTNKGRSWSGNVVTVLSPTMTNEALVSWSRLTLDNAYKDPAAMRLDTYGVDFNHSFPGASPYIPGVVSWGAGISSMWSAANDMFAHNDALQFSNKLTKIAGAHGLKFGVTVERLQKQQNFNNNEEGYLVFAPGWTAGSTGNGVADVFSGVIAQMQAGSSPPEGAWRMWNVDFFAQDSWKLRPNFTLEFGVRAGYWTNNAELNGLGGYFDPALYDPNQGQYLDPGTFQFLNGVRYVRTGDAPDGILPTRDPFAMPRINAAWDIDGQGNNVLRGGYGLFYNRNMGNVEYDNTLHLPPARYQTTTGRNDVPGQLTYETAQLATLAARLGASGINTLRPESFTFPKTHSFSVSYARRIFWNQVAEVAYVGTRGRDLVTRVNNNVVDQGELLQGTVGNSNLANPIHRYHLADGAVNSFRPFQAYPSINGYEFGGVSDYNSLQVTLSRQTGRRFQYFATYTLGRTKGTLGDEYRNRDPFDDARTYGIRAEDRTHVFNLSWNAFLPDGARGALDNPFGRGLLNGWQLSGISTVSSGVPIWLAFSGPAGSDDVELAYFGTPDHVLLSSPGGQSQGLAPVYSCDPRTGNTRNGEKLLDLSCIGFPGVGESGQVIPPFDLRSPTTQNHDLTLFKNFAIRGEQKLQFRVGLFNIFNQAFALRRGIGDRDADINLTLNTVCNRNVSGVPDGVGGVLNDVCDPTGGFSFDQNTLDNFGNINLLRGRRIIEFAVKYYF